jgi:hypothetical protein
MREAGALVLRFDESAGDARAEGNEVLDLLERPAPFGCVQAGDIGDYVPRLDRRQSTDQQESIGAVERGSFTG